MTDMTFSNRLDKLFEGFGGKQIMVLATAAEGRVTARAMSVIVLKRAFYFQTDTNLLKAKQMEINSRIALSFSNVSVEAVAERLGSPLSPECAEITEKYRAAYSGSYDAYSKLPTENMYRAKPALITLWQYEDGKPYREIYDLEKEAYVKEYYN
jgi:hypothetical protein